MVTLYARLRFRTYTALISCIKTTFVASPCHPLSPLAANKKLQVGSTTDRQLGCFLLGG